MGKRIDTKLERWFDGLPTANFRVFFAVLTSVIVTLLWSVTAAFGSGPGVGAMTATYTFLATWMGLETTNHYLRRKTYNPDLPPNRPRDEDES